MQQKTTCVSEDATDYCIETPRKFRAGKRLVVVAIILLLRQQGPVPAAGKILLQSAIVFGVGVFCDKTSVLNFREEEY